MAEKVIRGDLQGARMAIECDFSWIFQRKVACAIASPNTLSSRGFGQVGCGQLALMDQAIHWLVIGAINDVSRSRHDLLLENAWLRQQLIVVERQVKRPTFTWRDR